MNEELFKLVTKQFLPTKRLAIEHRPQDIDHLQRVLLSDFDFFCAETFRFPYFTSLERFLTINASTISIDPSPMTDKTINRFLKLWIGGAMPRLRQLLMYFMSSVAKKDVILNGINFTERGQDEERSGVFELEAGPMRIPVNGGLSIMRCDGTEATIELKENGGNVTAIEFYVWNQ